ncbi:phage tail protein, partial [Escherichia fergusonii]
TEAATPNAVKAAMDKAIAAAPTSHTHAWGQITGIPDGTLTQKGIVKLNNTTNSTSTTEAATPNAVKAAMDKATIALNNISASISDVRLGAKFDQVMAKGGRYEIPGNVLTGLKIIGEVDGDDLAIFRPLQIKVKGSWYTVGQL